MAKLTILVTGAGGFLGRATVAAARAAGHQVVAMTRVPADWDDPGVTGYVAHLGEDSLPEVLGEVDVVIHAAAILSGDDTVQLRDTVAPTRVMLQAMKSLAKPPRLVHVSSLSVLGYAGLSPMALIDEATPLENAPAERDAYTRAKLQQEADVLAASDRAAVHILRPGTIYGPDRVWNSHVGVGLGPVLIRIGGAGEMPLIHVTDCAAALVSAAEQPGSPGAPQILHLVGDNLPDRPRFLAALRKHGWPRVVLSLPWRALDHAGRVLSVVPGLPGLLRAPVLRARMMPLRYSNDRAKAALGWQPRIDFATGMARALEGKV